MDLTTRVESIQIQVRYQYVCIQVDVRYGKVFVKDTWSRYFFILVSWGAPWFELDHCSRSGSPQRNTSLIVEVSIEFMLHVMFDWNTENVSAF